MTGYINLIMKKGGGGKKGKIHLINIATKKYKIIYSDLIIIINGTITIFLSFYIFVSVFIITLLILFVRFKLKYLSVFNSPFLSLFLSLSFFLPFCFKSYSNLCKRFYSIFIITRYLNFNYFL